MNDRNVAYETVINPEMSIFDTRRIAFTDTEQPCILTADISLL